MGDFLITFVSSILTKKLDFHRSSIDQHDQVNKRSGS